MFSTSNSLQDDRVGSFPKDLSQVVGVEMVVLLRFRDHNKKFPNSSIAVVQYSKDADVLERFSYTKVILRSLII